MCGVYLNRARVISLIAFAPIAVVLLLTETILVGIGQDPETAHQSQIYLNALLPGVFFQLQNEPVLRFLQAQGIFRPQVVLIVLLGSLHILWCYLYISVAGLGVVGAGAALSTTHVIIFVVSYVYISYTNIVGEAWFCIGREAF